MKVELLGFLFIQTCLNYLSGSGRMHDEALPFAIEGGAVWGTIDKVFSGSFGECTEFISPYNVSLKEQFDGIIYLPNK